MAGAVVHGALAPFAGRTPQLACDVFIAAGSHVIGDVAIGEGSSVWFNCTLRADLNPIRIGRGSNIQDNSVVHIASGGLSAYAAPRQKFKTGKSLATVIGDAVTVGHGAVIHACTLEDGCLIGMGSVVLDGACVGRGALVAAGSLVPPGRTVGAFELWGGRPAVLLRAVKASERALIAETPVVYRRLAARYAGAEG